MPGVYLLYGRSVICLTACISWQGHIAATSDESIRPDSQQSIPPIGLKSLHRFALQEQTRLKAATQSYGVLVPWHRAGRAASALLDPASGQTGCARTRGCPLTQNPRRSWSPRAFPRFAFPILALVGVACSSDLTTPADRSPEVLLPVPMAQTGTSQARADLPVVMPDVPTPLRMRGTGGEAVSWTAIDGGEIQEVTLEDEAVTVFTAGEPGTYRVVGSSASFSAGDTTTITVVSAALTASITQLVIKPENASVQPNDTLRFSVWGLTAGGDSVPAAAKLYPSRGYVRGMDYYCPIEGEFTVTAGISGTSVRVTTDVTVSASASDAPPPPANSTGGTLARIEMTPVRDTIPPNDTLTFSVRGVSTTGSSMPVSVKLYADRGYVRGLSYYTPVEGTFRIRAVQVNGSLTATSYITVKQGAPPVGDGPVAPTDPVPEPEPDPAPTPDPDVTPVPPTASVAELPRILLDSRYVAPTGRTINVAAGGGLQAAINSAERGDQIVLAAGASFVGNFVLPPKSGTGWITIRSAGTLPPEGTRVTPSTAAGFAKLVSYNSMPALRTSTGASVSHYRLMGLEFRSNASMTYDIVNLGDYSRTASTVSSLPGNIIIDRSYIHGNGTQDIQRCVALNSRSTAIVDSWLSACHYYRNESQAIAGWYGPGPYKIVNNHISGGSENLMFGGADPKFSGLVPSDIEIRRNHFYKPLTWKGKGWAIKNLLEVKNGQRILIEGNLLENNWDEAQTGFAVVLKSQNQGGRCTWCVTQDVTWRYNKISNSPGGFNLMAVQAIDGGGAIPAKRIDIRHTVFDRVGLLSQPGAQRIFQMLGSLTYITIEHNTALGENHLFLFDGGPASTTNYVIRNNLFTRGRYGVFGSGLGEGTKALNYYARGGIFTKNALIAAPSSLYPAGNLFPTSLSAAGLGTDYLLSAASSLLHAATDGTMMGADVARLNSLLAGVK